MDMKSRFRLPLLPDHVILNDADKALVTLIQTGLPLTATPYADIAATLGSTEAEVLVQLKKLTESGIIKRFGIVVRHHELGYHANAMTVWDITDEDVTELGLSISKFKFVTLSYRRPRYLPDWPYNLFTMIHGQNRDNVLDNIKLIITRFGLEDINYTVLFSSRRFKQRGAIYHK